MTNVTINPQSKTNCQTWITGNASVIHKSKSDAKTKSKIAVDRPDQDQDQGTKTIDDRAFAICRSPYFKQRADINVSLSGLPIPDRDVDSKTSPGRTVQTLF